MIQKYIDPKTGEDVKHDGDGATPIESIQRGKEPVWLRAMSNKDRIAKGKDIPSSPKDVQAKPTPRDKAKDGAPSTKGLGVDDIQTKADEITTKNDGKSCSYDGYGGPPGGAAFPTQSFDGRKKISEKKLEPAASKGGTLGKRARLAETLKSLKK